MADTLRAALYWVAMAGLATCSGCLGDAIKANQDQLAQQQTQLDQLKREVEAMQVQNSADRPARSRPVRAMRAVMHEASRKGGERFAANDFPHALAYYEDAVSACPKNSRAQLNLARTYESIGDTPQARTHYQLAAAATGDGDSAPQEARDALARLR